MLKTSMAGLRLVVSYADTEQGHHGGIYQAGGWVMCQTSGDTYIRIKGKVEHRRVLALRYGTNSLEKLQSIVDPKAERVKAGIKHKYLMPLDDEMKKQIEPLRKPYPKRVRSVDSDTSATHAEKGGANPTRTLFIPDGESL